MLSLLENSFVKENPLQDLLSSLNAVIFKLHYNQIYQLKNTRVGMLIFVIMGAWRLFFLELVSRSWEKLRF